MMRPCDGIPVPGGDKGLIAPANEAGVTDMAKKKRSLDLPAPWSDFELFSTREWPESYTSEAKLLDEKFKDVHNVFHGLGAHLFENMVGRHDVILCNVCGILFFPENPDAKCPLCSLVRWLVKNNPALMNAAEGEMDEALDDLKPRPLLQDWSED